MTTYEEAADRKPNLETAAIATTLFAHRQRQLAAQVVSVARTRYKQLEMGRALGTDAQMKYITTINNKTFEIEIERDGSAAGQR